MVTLFLIIVVVALVIALVVSIGGSDRYSKMTEKEFEEEAERSSLLGAAMIGTQKLIQPSRVQAMSEQKKRMEKDAAPSREERSEEHTSELQSLAYLVCRL